MKRIGTGKRWIALVSAFGIVLAMMVAALAASPVSAQNEATGHPAHIHTGTCDALGDVEYPLSDVGPGVVKNGKAQENGDTVGATEDIYPVVESITTVKTTLADIADGNHAVNIHESADNIQVYIACGNIGGTVVNGDLVIGLEERSNSGYSGVAVLHPRDNGTVVVTVFLSEGLSGEAKANADNTGNGASTPDTTDTSTPGNATPTDEAVDIAGFAFAPAELQIAAGSTVTWTNQDSATHTVTADDGSFDSGNLAMGESFTQTFDTPGTYTYHCSIHSGMTGTVVVS